MCDPCDRGMGSQITRECAISSAVHLRTFAPVNCPTAAVSLAVYGGSALRRGGGGGA